MTDLPIDDLETRHREPTAIGSRTFDWGTRTFVMGILNVTPDSFSGDGLIGGAAAGAPLDPVGAAVDQARRMVEEGADLLDVGGESTRPGHAPVDAAEELGRVVPVVAAIHAALPDTPISIDTTKVVVAEAALAAGAAVLNDIWGTNQDTVMAELAARAGVPLIVMHNRDVAQYDDVVTEVVDDLARALRRAEGAGVPTSDLIVDPGIGFGKTADHNVTLLRHLDALGNLGRPILLGTSRKSTIGRILDLPADQRLEGTLATTALGIAAGVDIVRVHDVQPNVRVARVTDAIVRGRWRAEPETHQGGST
jgi:dihydropteroate synthase